MSVLFSVPSLFNLILFLKILVPQSRSFAFGFSTNAINAKIGRNYLLQFQTAVITAFQFGSFWQLPILAISLCCYLLYLSKLQLHRCRAAKDCDHHFQGLAIFVHVINDAIKVRK